MYKDLKSALTIILQNHNRSKKMTNIQFTGVDWDLLEHIVHFFVSVYIITDILEDQKYPTVCKAFPALCQLFQHYGM
jgi:hypothetical protein